MSDKAPSLSNAIQTLRDELTTAQEMGRPSGLHFLIDEISLELQLVATVQGEGKVKVGWSILGLESGATAAHASTHKIQLKMKLAPGPSGNDQQISGEGKPPTLGG